MGIQLAEIAFQHKLLKPIGTLITAQIVQQSRKLTRLERISGEADKQRDVQESNYHREILFSVPGANIKQYYPGEIDKQLRDVQADFLPKQILHRPHITAVHSN